MRGGIIPICNSGMLKGNFLKLYNHAGDGWHYEKEIKNVFPIRTD